MILTDAGRASDSERRKSVDSVHVYHGGHLIQASTSTQQVASLSTGDSEFHGIVRGAASGIQLRDAFMQFGFSVRLRVLSDSSAAQAVTAKAGSGEFGFWDQACARGGCALAGVSKCKSGEPQWRQARAARRG